MKNEPLLLLPEQNLSAPVTIDYVSKSYVQLLSEFSEQILNGFNSVSIRRNSNFLRFNFGFFTVSKPGGALSSYFSMLKSQEIMISENCIRYFSFLKLTFLNDEGRTVSNGGPDVVVHELSFVFVSQQSRRKRNGSIRRLPSDEDSNDARKLGILCGKGQFLSHVYFRTIRRPGALGAWEKAAGA